MKKLAVLTSGGDSPGMNAAIRAVVRTALHYDIEVYGVLRGYDGLMNGKMFKMDRRSVSNIIQKGGTILKTARSMDFKTIEGRMKAAKQLRDAGIEGLITIGGNGTFTGAQLFYQEHGFPVIGIPGTIDNDIFGSDYTIGYDTAVNTVLDAIDKIRDTADAHERVFFVEVMGRDTGYIAVQSAIAGGAEVAVIPEKDMTAEEIVAKLNQGGGPRGSHVIVVAEGHRPGRAVDIARDVGKQLPQIDTKVSILGHIQRGGSPTAADRILATILGVGAVEGILKGKTDVMVGVVNGELSYASLKDAITKEKPVKKELIRMIDIVNGRISV